MRAPVMQLKSFSLLFLLTLSVAACAPASEHSFADGALNEQGTVAVTPDEGYRLYQGAMQY